MGCSGAGCALGLSGTLYLVADVRALVLVVLRAAGWPAVDCCAMPRAAIPSSTSSVKTASTNAVDLFLSMNCGSPIDRVSVLMRYRHPLLSFLHHFFNAGPEIFEHHSGAVSSRASGY